MSPDPDTTPGAAEESFYEQTLAADAAPTRDCVTMGVAWVCRTPRRGWHVTQSAPDLQLVRCATPEHVCEDRPGNGIACQCVVPATVTLGSRVIRMSSRAGDPHRVVEWTLGSAFVGAEGELARTSPGFHLTCSVGTSPVCTRASHAGDLQLECRCLPVTSPVNTTLRYDTPSDGACVTSELEDDAIGVSAWTCRSPADPVPRDLPPSDHLLCPTQAHQCVYDHPELPSSVACWCRQSPRLRDVVGFVEARMGAGAATQGARGMGGVWVEAGLIGRVGFSAPGFHDASGVVAPRGGVAIGGSLLGGATGGAVGGGAMLGARFYLGPYVTYYALRDRHAPQHDDFLLGVVGALGRESDLQSSFGIGGGSATWRHTFGNAAPAFTLVLDTILGGSGSNGGTFFGLLTVGLGAEL